VSRPIPPRLARDLADVGLDPDQPALRFDAQTQVDNGRLFVEVNQLRERVADLERDVAYWSQRHDLYKALWTSLPRRVRARWFDRYNKAHPLTVEQLT
jgi:tetrahydromethanopterin S-methyltransferase subunit B